MESGAISFCAYWNEKPDLIVSLQTRTHIIITISYLFNLYSCGFQRGANRISYDKTRINKGDDINVAMSRRTRMNKGREAGIMTQIVFPNPHEYRQKQWRYTALDI